MIKTNLFPNDTKCKCGRVANELHCLYCGSFSVEGKSRLVVVVVETDNGMVDLPVRQYRCRRCGRRFLETDIISEKCNAEPVGLSHKAQTVGREIKKELSAFASPEERKAKLAELFSDLKKKGS